jgi:predicted alpha/beta superfamily hydrolase
MAEDFLHIAGLVQVLVGNGSMRPFLLVGIENTQRRRDLTGPTNNEEDKKIAPQVGGSAAFRKFIRTELMPAVTARYRTTPETAIIGESLAGLFVVETLFLEPDLFDTYIAFDPSVWWNDGGLLKGRVPASDRKKMLYLAASVDDRDGLTRQLSILLRKTAPANLSWHYERMSGETHATIYHPAAIAALRWLFKPGEEAVKGTTRRPPRPVETSSAGWIPRLRSADAPDGARGHFGLGRRYRRGLGDYRAWRRLRDAGNRSSAARSRLDRVAGDGIRWSRARLSVHKLSAAQSSGSDRRGLNRQVTQPGTPAPPRCQIVLERGVE